MIVGRLCSKTSGEPLVELEDNGKWSACDPKWEPMAEMIAATHDLNRDHECGDHHRPRGVALLCRAAEAYGLPIKDLREGYDPLPPGVVS